MDCSSIVGPFSTSFKDRLTKILQGSGKIPEALRISQEWFRNSGKGIPKIIMQTWKNETVPEQWKDSPSSFQKGLPGWNYVLMTDADNREFVQKLFPQFLKTYDSLPYPIMRADAIRYMWLYVIGGVYSDLDYKLQKDFTPLFAQADGPYYLIPSNNIHMVTNSFMASKPGVPIWKEALSAISFRSNPKHEPWWFLSKHWKVLGTTGPIMLQAVVDKSKIPYVTLPPKLINPCSVCELEFEVCSREKTVDAYLTQLRGCSWNADDSYIINSFFCRSREMSVAILIVLIFTIGLIIYAFKRGGSKIGWLLILIIIALLLLMLFPKIFT